MNKTYLKVKLGGKERGLNFKMGAKDELQRMVAERTDPKDQTETSYASMIIEAGLICNDVIKSDLPWGSEVKHDFTSDEIRKWVYEMEPGELNVIVEFFNSVFAPVAGESNKDTQR